MVPDRETEFLGTRPRFKKKFLEELFPWGNIRQTVSSDPGWSCQGKGLLLLKQVVSPNYL